MMATDAWYVTASISTRRTRQIRNPILKKPKTSQGGGKIYGNHGEGGRDASHCCGRPHVLDHSSSALKVLHAKGVNLAVESFAFKPAASESLAVDHMMMSWQRSSTGFALACDPTSKHAKARSEGKGQRGVQR